MNIAEANDTNAVLRALIGTRPVDDKVRQAAVRLTTRARKTLCAGLREEDIPAVLPDPRAEVEQLRAQVERMRQDRPAYQHIADEAVAESNRLRGLLCNVEYLEGRVRELHQADDFEAAERDRDAAGGEL